MIAQFSKLIFIECDLKTVKIYRVTSSQPCIT